MTRRARRALAAVAALALLAPGARAGQQAPPPQQAQPSYRATTTVVEVDASVTDRAGRFVEGLTVSDFEVLEEGVPQQIQTLYLVDGATSVPIAGAAPPAGASAERLPSSPAPQRVYVLVFDQDHLDSNGFRQLQKAAEQFLETQFQSGDIGGVLIGSTMVGNRLTSDREALIAGVRAAKPGQSQVMRKMDLVDWPRMSEVEAIRIALANDREVLDQVVRRAERDSAETRAAVDLTPAVMQKARFILDQLRPAAARTVATLQALIKGLARVSGRKTVVLLTDGFFVEESWGELRQIIGQAARANVRVYSIDAMGLRRNDRGTDLRQMTPLEMGASIPLEAYNVIEDGPNSLAFDTGGYAIRHTNDFSGALAEIARDASRYYILGYATSNTTMDGKFRTISVRVKRDGVRVRARRGYLATPEATTQVPVASGTTPAPAPDTAVAATPPAGVPAPPAAATPTPPASPTPAAPAESGPPVPTASPLALRPDTATRVRELATRAPDTGAAKTLASEGWDRYGKGDLEGAEKLLKQAAAQPGAAPWISYALGFAELGLRKPQDAAQSWERVRAAVPEFAAVHLDLTDAYLQLDDAGRAVEVLRAAEARWPEDTEVLNALGTVQVRRGSLNDAIDTFRKAIEARPKESLSYFNLARTYELRYYRMRRFSRSDGRWIDNPDDLKKAIENYDAYLTIGGAYDAEARAAVERLRWVK